MKKFEKIISILIFCVMITTMIPTRIIAETKSEPVKSVAPLEIPDNPKKEAKIIAEVESKRGEYTKQFLLDDMSYQAVLYQEPVHYLVNGKWEDIDNSMTEEDGTSDNEAVQEPNTNSNADLNNNSSKNTSENNLAGSDSQTKDEKTITQVKEEDKENIKATDEKSASVSSQKAENTASKSKVFTNKKNNFKINISKKSNAKKLVSIEKDKYQVDWSIQDVNKVDGNVKPIDKSKVENAIASAVDNDLSKEKNEANKAEKRITKLENEKKKTLTNISSTIDFKSIFDNIDLQYNTIGDKVKENIIINKPTDKTDFTFNLNVKNLIAKLQKDNSIVFYDSKQADKAVLAMNAPFMFDSKQAVSNNIKMNLTETKKGYTLTLSANKEWINSADRAYPITIDPDVQTSQNIKDIKDTFVASNDTEDKYNNIFLKVGQTPSIGTTRSYLKFNLPTITSADMVIYAQLNLTSQSSDSGNGGAQVNAYEVTSSWGGTTAQGLKWDNQPSSSVTISDYATVSSSYSGWNSWSITDIVKKWYNTGNNYGLMLASSAGSSGYVSFLSSDCGDGWTANRPFISISYINNSGLESYWTYHSQDAKRAGTGYINDYNGNLVFVHSDMSTGGTRLPVTLNHVYNSNDKEHHGFGLGWRLNYTQHFEYKYIEGAGGYYVYTDEDGTKHYFLSNSNQQIEDELKLGLTLIKETNNTYTIKDKKNNIVNFINTGEVRYIADSNGNSIDFTYGTAANGTKILTNLTESSGRVTKLNYYSYGSVQEIVDPAGRKTSFQYDGAGNLYKITYPDGNSSTYTYVGSDLTSVTNYDGYKISYQYYDAAVKRVKKALESHTDGTIGEELNVSYGNNSTSFADFKGKKEIYQFDYAGKTVSVKAPDGTAEYYTYDSGNITKMGMSSKLQSTVSNILLNHSAESDANWGFSTDGGLGNVSFTSEDKYIGNRSIKISKNNNVSRHYAQEVLPLKPGKTYTFSSYVKTSNITSSNSGGAYLGIYYLNSSGSYTEVASNRLTGTNAWDRIQVTFTLPTDIKSNNVIIRSGLQFETGTAYFDAFQLEEGSAANRYNLVENGEFIYGAAGSQLPDGWTIKDNFDARDVLTTNSESRSSQNINNNCFTISGNGSVGKDLGQMIYVSGKSGDPFILSGWAKGNSVPLKGNRHFAVHIVFFNGGTRVQGEVAEFNTDSSDWQYISKNIIANSDYTSVNVYLIYYSNENSALFDGIQLYKEEFGASYKYDAKGNVASTTSLAKQNSKFDYNGNNDLITYTDPKGSQFKYEYDNNSGSGKHNLTKATTAENVVYSFEYDSFGNPKTAKIGDGSTIIQSSATYTTSGNYVKTMTDAIGNTITYNNDETKDTLTSVVDAKGNTTNYGYDTMDRLTSTSKISDSQTITNSYSYENDRIKTITHNGFSYNFGYDSLGNNKSVDVGSQNLIKSTYESRTGKLMESTYGNGQKVSSDYDDFDKVIAKRYSVDARYPGDVRYSYQYDGNNNLAYLRDAVSNVEYRYIYDFAERISKIKDSSGNIINFEYDNNNNVSKVSENIGSNSYDTTYGYDKDNKNKTVIYSRNNQNNTITNSYDTLARLTSKNVNTGTAQYNIVYGYISGVASQTSKIGSVSNNGNTISYSYDKNGNIETISQSGKNIKYSYNELNELTREDNGVTGKTIVYSYDAGGNIKTKTEYPYTTGSVGVASKTYVHAYTDSNWKDKLTVYDGKAITYDQIGNPTNYNGYTYTWEQGRQLAGISGNGLNTSYKYNDSGIRTQKTSNGVITKYHLVGDKVTYEDNGSDKIYYTYDSSAHLVSMNLNGVECYYIRNAQGDIIGLFDKNGSQVVSYTYDSWGKLIAIDGSLKDSVGVKNPYRYRGYRYDSETGLYYLQSRYYNPEWGRFINADATFGFQGELLAANLFAYCMNNPVNLSDEDGFRPIYTVGEENDAMIEASIVQVADKSANLIKIKYGEHDLEKGYTGRVDRPHVANDQNHVHVYKKGKEVANQNEDGTPHHKEKCKPGEPTSRVKGKLKEKSGWDWDSNGAKHNVAKGAVVVGGGYLLYRGARMIPSLLPPLWWTIPANALAP